MAESKTQANLNKTLLNIAEQLNEDCKYGRIAQIVLKVVSLIGSIGIVVAFGVSFSDYNMANWITLLGAILSFFGNLIIHGLTIRENKKKDKAIRMAMIDDNIKDDDINKDILEKFCEMSLEIDSTFTLGCCKCFTRLRNKCCKRNKNSSKNCIKVLFKLGYDAAFTLLPGAVLLSSVKTLGAAITHVPNPQLVTHSEEAPNRAKEWMMLSLSQKLTEGFEGALGAISLIICFIGLGIHIIRGWQFRKKRTPLMVVQRIEDISNILTGHPQPEHPGQYELSAISTGGTELGNYHQQHMALPTMQEDRL